MRDIDLNGMKLEDGQIPGIDDVFSGIKEKYKGLIDLAKEPGEGEHEEPEGGEVKEKEEDEDGAENKAAADENLETLKQKSLANKHNSGITFGVSTNKKSVQTVKSGRSFN